jgi:HEPN domain-containing protein
MERANDADAMLPDRSQSAGPVYMAGYAVECMLKAYLQKAGIQVPTSGAEGHNLRGLWKQAGLQLSDLRDEHGNRAFFIEDWSTDMRYQTDAPQNRTSEELVQAARQLAGRVRTLMRRRQR